MFAVVLALLFAVNPRIAALQRELAAIDRPEASQEAWQKMLREAGDDENMIVAAYLARIEELRLADGTFGSDAPPPSIFGRYSKTEPLCLIVEGTNDYKCEDEAESYIEVKRGKGNRVEVESELTFFNGHQCSFSGAAEWRDGALRVPQFDYTNCVLLLHFNGGNVTTEDVSNVCRSYLCGMRGGFANIELPKLKPKAKKKRKR